MGFDFNVIIRLQIDSSGVQYAYEHTGYGKVPYVSEPIPEKFLRWVQARGSHFYAYIPHLGDGQTEVEASYFLHHFPDWIDVKAYLGEECWSEEDHYEFHEAVVWFAARPWFNMNWSY